MARRGKLLSRITLAYNTGEGLASIVAGTLAGSIALVGFGIDSVIEVISSTASLWRLHSDHDEARRERSERMALQVVGWCFLALAAYIALDAGHALYDHEIPRWQDRPPSGSFASSSKSNGRRNPDARTAMSAQLVEWYLVPHSVRAGLYLVVYFNCPAWARANRQQVLCLDRSSAFATK